MAISEFAKQYREKLFPGRHFELAETDPEFVEMMNNFALDEVIRADDMEEHPRFLAILAALIGCQGVEAYKVMLPAALEVGVTPVEVKETVYQATAYLGIGRVLPFLHATNVVLTERGVRLPLEGQSSTTSDTRLEKGEAAQVEIFGEHMRGFAKTGKEEKGDVNKWLAANCFGDYYTRGGLNFCQREMITFCFLMAEGGCEMQLKSHAAANLRIGNDRAFLVKVICQCLPYIGYPRALNAFSCLAAVAEAHGG